MHPLILASPSADHEGGGIARPEHAASMRFLCASWNAFINGAYRLVEMWFESILSCASVFCSCLGIRMYS